MKMKLILIAACGVALTPAAFAAKPAHQNPVVDLSSLEQPGLYQTTSITISDGAAEKPVKDTECVTAAELRNYFNSEANADVKVTSYKLDDNHLRVKGDWMGNGKKAGTVAYDLFFDSPTQWHGILKMLINSGAMKSDTTIKLKARRVGDCKKEA